MDPMGYIPPYFEHAMSQELCWRTTKHYQIPWCWLLSKGFKQWIIMTLQVSVVYMTNIGILILRLHESCGNHLVRSMFAFVVLTRFQKTHHKLKYITPSCWSLPLWQLDTQTLRVTEKTPTVSERQSRYSGLSSEFFGTAMLQLQTPRNMSGTLRKITT